jgi:DNA-binding transcriptional LysR family regulator
MGHSEWLRTFVAIYRTRSISRAAVLRGLSQPAASQQLAKLEAATGTTLFHRRRGGLEPTIEARSLFGQVVGPLDLLEPTFAGLEVGTLVPKEREVLVGCTTAFPAEILVSRLGPSSPRVSISFASDADLVALLYSGELDIAMTPNHVRRSREYRSLRAARATTVHIGDIKYVLVIARELAPRTPITSLEELGAIIDSIPWVGYSSELPITRSFVQTHLHRPFSGDLRLTAPDLRVTLRAIERGVGAGLIPKELCETQLKSGALVELFPVADYIPVSAVFASVRRGETARPEIAAVLGILAE